ncbi:tyrosine-protein kinase [Pedobacter jeongneungensis]|uniref:non-specific protein-tyrosine kinase n=1 Tax=Pedobacter jeongneungensis TaxID=947309 RepID=A0ABP8BF46_9SPHI
MNNPEMNSAHEREEVEINFKDIFNKFLDKWNWFLISIIICLFTAYIYGKYTAPSFQISAKLIVNDDQKGSGIGKQAGALMDLGGIMGSKNSVDNEVEILKTRFLMEQVVRDMRLNIVYSKKIGLVSRELYQSPFKINILKSVDTIAPAKLKVVKVSPNKFLVSTKDFKKEASLNETFNFPGIGVLEIESNSSNMSSEGEFYVSISSIDSKVASLMGQFSVAASNKQVSIIDLKLTYPLPKKGEDILNTLIKKYTQSNLNDKNAVADSTYRFIKERLNVIASELGDVENKVENFKQQNQLADMSEQGKLLVQSSGQFSAELAKAETQVSVVSELEKYIKDGGNSKRAFPSSLIPQDIVFSNIMEHYNSLVIERERQLLSVTEQSPFIQNIDQQIAELRNNIISNIQSTKKAALLTRDKLRNQLKSAENQISGVPQVEKNYLKLARNQQIKQELYIFLMQKAEETNISKTANISIAKTIDPPKSEVTPSSPKKSIIYFLGLIMGIVFPISMVFGLEIFNTSIDTKEEITSLTRVPVIGEISHNKSDDNLVVANQSRSAISEQFRALRTNLSFYLKKENEKIILLTSSMSGEGKSFTAINLGNILALAGKKVLLMELDLRKPGLSAKLGVRNDMGFSNFTISPEVKMADIVKPLSINKNMFIISSGPLPPNPAETLMNEHVPSLIEKLKLEFDYIIMDAPPVGIIADAQLLSRYADVTLYLVRQKVTQKNQLKIVEELYLTNKMKNLGIVVNDIISKYYGYGYGYGTYGENTNEKWYRRIFKR